MINNNYQNSSCMFAEQTAEYLYGEIEENDKKSFESHLQGCKVCTDELADFSLLRSSIAEWRSADFEPLLTPAIVLPIANQTVTANNSLSEKIRAYFVFSPALTAAVIFVLLALFSGTIWFATSHQNMNEMATVSKEKISSPSQTPVSETSKFPDIGSRETVNSVATPSNSLDKEKSDDGKNTIKPVKASADPAKQARPVKTSTPGSIKNNVTKSPSKNVPALVNDEGEDSSLRLSDIFDEVGMYKSDDDSNNE